MEKARNCFEYKLSGDWRVIGEKKRGNCIMEVIVLWWEEGLFWSSHDL